MPWDLKGRLLKLQLAHSTAVVTSLGAVGDSTVTAAASLLETRGIDSMGESS